MGTLASKSRNMHLSKHRTLAHTHFRLRNNSGTKLLLSRAWHWMW